MKVSELIALLEAYRDKDQEIAVKAHDHTLFKPKFEMIDGRPIITINEEAPDFLKYGPGSSDEKDVHTEHCCYVCGCKYGNSDCPVALGRKRQSFPHTSDYMCLG